MENLYTIEEFNAIRNLVDILPPQGSNYLQVLLLNKILKVLTSNESELLKDLKNDTLKKICEDKKIDTKNLKTKEELTKAIIE